MVYTFFDKKTSATCANKFAGGIVKNKNMLNKELAEDSTIKIKSVDVKSNTYINSSKEIIDKDSKFKVGGIVSISKYKNIFFKMLHSKLVRRGFRDEKS